MWNLCSYFLSLDSKRSSFSSNLIELFWCKIMSWLLTTDHDIWSNKLYHIFVVVVSIILELSWLMQNFLHWFLVCLFETFKKCFMLFCMLLKFEKVCQRLLIIICVTEEVKHISHFTFNEFNLLICISLDIQVEFTGCCFKNIRLASFGAHGNDFIDSSLNIQAREIINIKQILENTFIGLFWFIDQIFVTYDEEWIEFYLEK